MMDWLRKWWAAQNVSEQKADDEAATDELVEMDKAAEDAYNHAEELTKTREILSEARNKNMEADDILRDYIDRIQRVNERRIAMAKGERPK